MIQQLLGIKLERRENVSTLTQVLAILAALFGATLITAILLRVAEADVRAGFIGLVTGAFGGVSEIIETLIKATPLILTGLATVVAYRGQMWNIGQEGQLYAGAVMSYLAYMLLHWLPSPLLIVSVMISGLIGGAIWGGFSGLLKARFNVDEVLSTIMLNYIITYGLNYLVSANGPWIESGQFFPQTPLVSEAARFPVLPGTSELHIGLILALLASGVVYFMLQKTPLGYEIRAFGSNPVASRFKGIKSKKMFIVIMLISGCLAGFAGAGQLFGYYFRLRPGISSGYGFSGIFVALLADLNPIAVIPAAILFGGLANGAFRLQVITGVPTHLVYAIEAIIMFFFIGARAAVKYRVRRFQYAK